MEKIVIIGSGFSSLTAFLKFEKYNPIVITPTQNKLINSHINVRKNLKTNKLFSSKGLSKGNLKFNLKNNTKLHDRLSFGGNSNIWGGFININSIEKDGTKEGYDFEYFKIFAEEINIPLVISGGSKGKNDFLESIQNGFNSMAGGACFVFQGKHDAVLITYDK